MGEYFTLLNSLNLSPINTLLLVALVMVLRSLYTRIDTLEQLAHKNSRSSAFIKGRLGIEEEDE